MLIVEKNNDVPCLQKIDFCFGRGCYHKDDCLAVKAYRLKWKEKDENRTLTKEEYRLWRKLKRIKKHGYTTGYYTVKSGDKIPRICDRFGLSIEEFRNINIKNGDVIKPGDKVKILSGHPHE